MAKLPNNDPLRQLAGLKALQSMSKTLEATRPLQGNMFPRTTTLKGIISPLDTEVLKGMAGANFIGTQLRESLDQMDASVMGRGIASSAAFSAGRLNVGDSTLQQASLKIAELYGGQFGIGKFFERWKSPLQDFGAQLDRFVEEGQKLDERTNEFVEAHGWPVPLNLPVRAYRKVVGFADKGKREVTYMMTRNFRPGRKVFRLTTDVLLESPQLESRRPLIKQSLAAYRRREWYLVVNGLLPLVEGVLVDYAYQSAPPPRQGRTKAAIQELRDKEATGLRLTVDTLETMLHSAGANVALFDNFDHSEYGGKGEPRSLNRNAILHGAARRYGSEQNALRLLLLVAVMAESFDLADST